MGRCRGKEDQDGCVGMGGDKSGKRGTQTLAEDGIYQIRIKAKDRAGYEAEDHRQIIIDKANPVIGYVDDLQGKYLKSFNVELFERRT